MIAFRPLTKHATEVCHDKRRSRAGWHRRSSRASCCAKDCLRRNGGQQRLVDRGRGKNVCPINEANKSKLLQRRGKVKRVDG